MARSPVRVVLSVVKVLVVSLWLGVSVSAATLKDDGESCIPNPKVQECQSGCNDWGFSNYKCGTKNGSGSDPCQYLYSNLSYKRDTMNADCVKSGMSSASCLKQAQTCATDAGSNLGSSLSSIISAGMMPSSTGMQMPYQTQSLGTAGCYDLDSSDYNSQYREIMDKVQDLQGKASDVDGDIADAKKDIDEKKTKIATDTQEAKEALDQFNNDNQKDKREAVSAAAKKVIDDTKAIQDIGQKKLAAQKSISNCQKNFQKAQLSLGNKVLTQTSCLMQVSGKQQELEKPGAVYDHSKYGSSGNLALQKREKDLLQNVFDACIKDIKQQFLDAQTTMQSCQQQGISDINNATQDEGNLQQQISTDNANAQEALQQLKDTATQKQQDFYNKQVNFQQELQDAQVTVQQKVAALQKKQALYNSQVQQEYMQLTQLGPKPPNGVKSGWREAYSSANQYDQANTDYDKCRKQNSSYYKSGNH